ncbi:FAD-dependent monooxygenase [Rhodococcus sp. NPDC003348]
MNPPSPVLILGGGPVGLAASLELARFGVASVLLEQHESVAWHPKTRNFNTRTMEIARHWGPEVYARLRDIDTPPGWKSPIRFFDSVLGREFGTIVATGFEGPGPTISPAQPVMSSQDLLEKILLDAAAATGLVDVRFGHRVTGVVSGWADDDETTTVEVTERATGRAYALTGSALVAADGATSLVRDQLGIELTGEKAIHHFVNCYFHADIEEHIPDRRGVLLFVANSGAAGVLQPLDARGRWLCQIPVAAEDWSDDVYQDEDCRRWVRAAVGKPDLEVEVRSIGRWQMNATVADRFVQGRIVLCGDAAHQFPPTGGLGVNTGLQGMHNAMWKLALCVTGAADWSLLHTYDTERRLPSQRTTRQSFDNHKKVQQMGAAQYSGQSDLDVETVLRETRRYGNHLGVEFGTVYDSFAVVPDGTAAPVVDDDYSDYQPSATPGCRAPHVWLGRSGTVSTVDLFGAGFTVLTGPGGATWRGAAERAAGKYAVPVPCYHVGDPGLEDDRMEFLEAYGIGDSGAVLVRPDGYIAWRSADLASDPVAEIDRVVSQILAHGGGDRMTSTPDRPRIDHYPTVEGRWNPPNDDSLTVAFLGTSSLLIRAGETSVMIDGFLSRPSLQQVLGGPIAPDPAVVDACLERAGVDALDAVVVVHSHYDHAFDAPVIAGKFGAPLIGSASTANIGRGYGLSEELLRVVGDGETVSFGSFDISFVETVHCPGDVSPGTIDEPLVPPATADAWHSAECYTLLVRHVSGTVLVQASANFVPGKLEGISADVVYLGIGMLGKQDAAFRDEYWDQLVRATDARSVIPVHWDDFMTPLLDGPLQPQPYLMEDVIPSMDFVFEQGRRDGVTVLLPTLWTPLAPLAGPRTAITESREQS